MTKHVSPIFEYRTTIKEGDPVDVLNPKTGKAMGGRWTFVSHVTTDSGEWVDVYQASRDLTRSFPTDRIRPKGI